MRSLPATSPVSGNIIVPGDKSISHRAIMLGAIAEGITSVRGFLDGEDCLMTLRAFQAMGVHIDGPTSQCVVIHGVGKYGLQKPQQIIDCGNSGTTMRLLAGILVGQAFDSQLTGDESLCTRPMERISQPLMQMGAEISTTNGCAPLSIYGGKTLHGIRYTMPIASAQVKSCLLLAGLYAHGETCIIESKPTRDHTERMMSTLSYPIHQAENMSMITSGNGVGTEIIVPGDISAAAFFIVAATIIPGSVLQIKQVGLNNTRIGIIKILQQMGADITIIKTEMYGEELVGDLIVKYAPIRGIVIPEALVPLAIDEFPIIFIAAACAEGQTVLRGARELRHKESDRILAMVQGLQTLGIDAEDLDDGVLIRGGSLHGGTVDSYMDHRIAMSFVIAGAAASTPVTILNTESIKTSFPNFVQLANTVNLNIMPF